MATTQLRLRGVTPLHLAAAIFSAVPFAFLSWQVFVLHRVLRQPAIFAFAALIAALPWLSRALARSAYRAKLDDVAVHVRGEALPWKTISAVTVEKTARRHLLTLQRGQTVSLQLVLWDAFAGRLEPRDALARKLAEHGHTI